MQLNSQSLLFIQRVVDTAKLAGVDSVVIEPDRVRAADTGRSVLIFQDTGIVEHDFHSIGLSRLDVFGARFKLTQDLDNFSVDVTMATTKHEGVEKSFVRSLTMRGGGTKVDYRCANPATISAPKSLAEPNMYTGTMTSVGVQRMAQGVGAMSAEAMTLTSTGGVVTLTMADVNNDLFEYIFETEAFTLTGERANFSFKYPAKKVAALFKANPTGTFYITGRGMLKILVNNLTIVVLPLA